METNKADLKQRDAGTFGDFFECSGIPFSNQLDYRN